MLQKLSVVAVLIFLSCGAFAADEHQEKSEKKSSGRPAATKSKASLAEKISACLTERPSKKEEIVKPSSSPSSSSSPQGLTPSSIDKPSDSTAEGAALFTKHCASCHSAGDIDWATAKQVVGVTMPFGKVNTVTPEEVAKLKEYFQTQIK